MLAAENEGLATLWVGSFDPALLKGILLGTDGYELTHSIWGKKENDWKAMDEKTIYKCENGQLASVEYLHINQQGRQKVINSLIVSDPFEQLLLAGSANNGSNR